MLNAECKLFSTTIKKKKKQILPKSYIIHAWACRPFTFLILNHPKSKSDTSSLCTSKYVNWHKSNLKEQLTTFDLQLKSNSLFKRFMSKKLIETNIKKRKKLWTKISFFNELKFCIIFVHKINLLWLKYFKLIEQT